MSNVTEVREGTQWEEAFFVLFGKPSTERWGKWGWVREGKAASHSRKQNAVLDAGTGLASGDS